MAKLPVLMGSVAALWLLGCGDSGVEGNGQRSEELRETATFSRIRSNCELDVEVVQGPEPSVLVSIDSNLQGLVRTRVENETLHIDTDDQLDDLVEGPHVLVTAGPLTAAKLSGSGRMALWLEPSDTPFDAYVSGSGAMRLEGRTTAVGAYLSGSGAIRLLGETDHLDVGLSGSGSVDAHDLQAESATIELNGSGDISARVSESVSVSLSGSGDVELYGDASLVEYRATGSGDVTQHD